MSGTSLDGIDAALLGIEAVEGGIAEGVDWELLAFRFRPYSPEERAYIRGAIEGGGAREMALLHTGLGEWFASATLDLLEGGGVDSSAVAAIGCHGQTVWHEPPHPGSRGSSLQLGCPATIAERTDIGVVSDFRSKDLAAGGHGAPLVPWADRLLFSSSQARRALQNLGGMGNVTWLPTKGSRERTVAFDTGPGVVLLDAAAELATDGAWRYDQDGEMALQGRVSQPTVDALMSHAFFREAPPRSTGREAFGPGLVAELARKLAPGSGMEEWPDLLATLTAFTARSIGDAYREWILPLGVEEVFLTGGGARNPALVRAISQELVPLPVRAGEGLGMDPDAREAAAFAALAWAFLRGVPSNVPEATGSSGPRVLGSWTPGRTGVAGQSGVGSMLPVPPGEGEGPA
jgi:anhydro-N-acetylmuramic acid kinase